MPALCPRHDGPRLYLLLRRLFHIYDDWRVSCFTDGASRHALLSRHAASSLMAALRHLFYGRNFSDVVAAADYHEDFASRAGTAMIAIGHATTNERR